MVSGIILNFVVSSRFHYSYTLIESNGGLDTGLVTNGIQRFAKILQLIRVCHDSTDVDFSCLEVMNGAG